ncbi:hypothetical protein LOTGIDRAFT_196021 [Lottia gigantea]|uniref:NADH dehydrogenase [ubiquinone] 1 alpha subcomplex subunit 5 n=1 Tax=Lottia gigantea TaxID=225164 RepID=V3ZLR2_LOTGI|nr:hypothetical protein LOTGIDRAFT_196021 [Lottia gigantea]ESO85247.1 hypothetical protein LOTGIDRAFT_196021 [Lottia gigantea]
MAAVTRVTGRTGLLPATNPHWKLTILYEKILATLSKMPQEAGYRKHTEALIKEREHIVKTEPDVAKVEAKINNGLIEELILQASRELSLSRKMLEWKPWQPLIEEAPTNQWKWPI